jgi:hypothetical protein
LGVTDDIEYTVALPDARSVTTTLASVSGATTWGRTDDGAFEPAWGPNEPPRGASAPAGRLKAEPKANVHINAAHAAASPWAKPLLERCFVEQDIVM